ncbi:hypothetical protein FPQ18DRAFT_313773 [Pyronema domesticum]|uniref:Similar to PCI domain-containing protein C1105.07c acc. no. Q9Y820 n=1 Tax=Pyronema omphalodes (strain CBS 100304) TaxID=1076935 RepID=U4LDH4_PYROM|nr:hypothetical protein FPQ18DRAFT_313773 [Pyronema domesticum]CCX29903.1 Similar to PCI domain-containing protein C1105.07c; acc. no. Q9Y820 [Pyronema omphalodes CBS 100304]
MRQNFNPSNPPTPPLIEAWTQAVQTAVADERPRLLHECFVTNVEILFKRKPFPALHQAVRQIKYLPAVRNIVEREMGDDWIGLNEMMVSYLWMLEAAVPNIMTHQLPSFPQETKLFFDRLKEFMSAVNSAFNSPKGAIIARTAMMTAKWCLLVAQSIDKMNGDNFYKTSESLLNVILRTFNISVAERAVYNKPGQLLKKTVTIDLANYLFKLYNMTCQTKLAGTIRQNLGSVGLKLQHPLFRNPTLCTYHYFEGIEYLNKLAFGQAHVALQASYDICHPRFLKHRRKILIPLLATSILVGRFPGPELISRPEAQGLDELFIPLCRAIQKGDFRSFRMAMGIEGPEKWKAQWWEQHQLGRIIEHRANILIWRSLIRKIWTITYSPVQQQQQTPQVLKIDDIYACAAALHRKSPEDINYAEANQLQQQPHLDPYGVCDPESWWFDGLRLTRDQVEGVVQSLLDQKMVRGYAVRKERGESTILVLAKDDPFPNVWKLCAPKAEIQREANGGGARVVRMQGVKEIGQN